MRTIFKTLTIISAMTVPMLAYAADTADTGNTDAADVQQTASAPPKDVTTYPCWDMMQDGHMRHMHGMMNGNIQMPPQGVKAHTCWDVMQNGHTMHMHNTHMMWNPPKQK